MIQRKQTIYLLAIVLIGLYLIFGNPVMYHLQSVNEFSGATERVEISFSKIETIQGDAVSGDHVMNSFLLYGLAVITGLAFGGIFMYKNRKMQLLLTGFNYLFMSAMALLIYYYISQGKSLMPNAQESALHYIVFLPVLFPLWNFLAMRGIMHDEKLVRSMDRLR
ncbi:MAG: DUF4293 family protein [Bacteroidetes bacterium]|nr:MAG: DUF4293 family protein [Bacteroidota bacterium]